MSLLRLPRPRRPLDGAVPDAGLPGADEVPRPAGPAGSGPAEEVTVEVVDSPTTVDLLAGAVPRGWRVVGTRRPSHHPRVDFVVLHRPSPAALRAAVAGGPGTAVAVLLPADAPVGEVASSLDAGVCVCLRGGSAALLAGHLAACRRRWDRTPG